MFVYQVSNGMFENVYAPTLGAFVYVAHEEPLKHADKGKVPKEPGSAKEPPKGTGSGASGSTQHWSDYSAKVVPPEESDGEETIEVNLHKHEGDHIKEADLTPIRLHDVWMFDWYQSCKKAGRPVGSLKHIIMPNIAETHTLTVLKELMQGHISWWEPWPGTQWLKEDNQPLIGTLLGTSVAKLIVQRPRLFGSERDLEGGRIWWTPPAPGAPAKDKGTLSMIFTLVDAPKALLEQQQQELNSRGGGGHPSPGSPGNVVPQKRPPGSSPAGEPAQQRPKGVWG